jgi:protein involved in polysaccharide export with SLBB domain
MKNLVFAALVLSASLAVTASGQVKSVAAANKQPTSKTANASPTANHTSVNSTRPRVSGQDSQPVPAGSIVSSGPLQARARAEFNNHTEPARFRRVNISSGAAVDFPDKITPSVPSTNSAKTSTATSNLKPSTTTAPANAATIVSAPIAAASTQVYRVGAKDVLDIQLSDVPSGNSTLFTVLEDGTVEYPLAGSPIVVDGMTTTEIAALLRQRIKIFDNPTVAVSVRDYASHAVTISGFVAAPGTKVLRREAVPLYTVLAEALILPDAARATITRPERAPIVVDLKDANLSATLVIPGDVIKVSGQPALPTEFYFVGGEITSPGQKPYHAGLTLTQAILASGGTSTSAGSKVRVSRQGADGRLGTEEYNLRKIQAGKTPDPVLQNGDRIDVTTAN